MTNNSNKASLDTVFHSAIGRTTGGLSPTALATAYLDWALHLAGSPERQMALIRLSLETFARSGDRDISKRFKGEAWQAWPYRSYAQTFSAAERWWHAATTDLKGVDPRHEQIVAFMARQMLDLASPANCALTNPYVNQAAVDTGGQNFVQGARYWIEDMNRMITGEARRADGYAVGDNMATTPGDVVVRTDLMELIRYRPTTQTIRPEPVLIVPAWIMKYYILDLEPQRSMVAYLRDKGFEVFILSWKNPGSADADFTLQSYIDLGVRAALDHVAPKDQRQVHAVGYCLGGTLLSMTAAAMGRDGDSRLRSLTLLASQVDFAEPGELGLFINESQVAFLEDIMKTQGYLEAHQMAGAFQMLRSTDLIWSRMVRHYLLGERTDSNALMAWNSDATRMPAAMHSEYLRQLYLNNALAKGRFQVDGSSVALTDIRCPIYCVGTERDHVSPWRSVYKLLLLSDTDVSFVLTNGGHNGGVLSEPGHKGRHFRVRQKDEQGPYLSAEDWFDACDPQSGSWWDHWTDWLADRSQSEIPSSTRPETAICAAPGTYVFD